MDLSVTAGTPSVINVPLDHEGPPMTADLAEHAHHLLRAMVTDPYGDFSPSVYETARLVTLLPGLPGHAGRVAFLLDRQAADGGWGGPEGYGLLPTLSATEGLLTEFRRTGAPAIAAAAEHGLRALSTRWGPDLRVRLPDTVAVEILVPSLVSALNAHLDALAADGVVLTGGRRLPHPEGTHPALLHELRRLAEDGRALPDKILHSLEALGPAARNVGSAPGENGLGCSPAATAAWLGGEGGAHPGLRYLENVQARHGGAVPVAAPLTVFERSWVLSTFADAGLAVTVPDEVLDDLAAEIGPHGLAGGAGLPPDADDTSTALYALAAQGRPHPLDCLREYHVDGHFCTYPDERTPSVTTNAHVLQALCAHGPSEVAGRVAAWIGDQQHPDGSWTDKWHASPYYATARCFLALAGSGRGATARARALRWIAATQRPDGSWGRWQGTFEETAYAVQVLARAGEPWADEAAARGCVFLLSWPDTAHPPLWHDKDLYTPGRIVRAEGIAALHLARRRPRVAALLARLEPAPAERTA
nr:prenyltransferase/squalene oxidase repeat-containing protein [Amycolatopsis ruanii]